MSISIHLSYHQSPKSRKNERRNAYFFARPGVVSSHKVTESKSIPMLPVGYSARDATPQSINMGRGVKEVEAGAGKRTWVAEGRTVKAEAL